jgi:transposase
MKKKKAWVAVAHTILLLIDHLLSRRVAYTDLDSDHVDRRHLARQRHRLVEQLHALGVKVTIEDISEAA